MAVLNVIATVELQFTRATKRTYRYDSIGQPGQPPPTISNLYIDKSAVNYATAPKTILLTVSVPQGDAADAAKTPQEF